MQKVSCKETFSFTDGEVEERKSQRKGNHGSQGLQRGFLSWFLDVFAVHLSPFLLRQTDALLKPENLHILGVELLDPSFIQLLIILL